MHVSVSKRIHLARCTHQEGAVLRYMHRQSIMHRDISFNNLMIASNNDTQAYNDLGDGLRYANQVFDEDE
jgi:serine/threonine protein kinase